MLDFNTNTKNYDEYITPAYILEALGVFDLDPCAPEKQPWATAKKTISLPNDGLKCDWGKQRVWLNPPYGRETFKWIEKLADHGNGIALIYARTETKGFHRQIWERAKSVFFFEGRLKFCRVDGSEHGSANAPSCLVAYGRNNNNYLRNSGLRGVLTELCI